MSTQSGCIGIVHSDNKLRTADLRMVCEVLSAKVNSMTEFDRQVQNDIACVVAFSSNV